MATRCGQAEGISAETKTSHITGTSKPKSREGNEREAAGKQALPERTWRGLAAEDRVLRVLLDWRNDDLSEPARAALARMSERAWRRYKRQVWPLALAMRRNHYAEHLFALDAAMIKYARLGSYRHLLLCYQRIEGFVPGTAGPVSSSSVEPDGWDPIGAEIRSTIAAALSSSARDQSDRLAP